MNTSKNSNISLADLKTADSLQSFQSLQWSLLESGVPKGAVSEISGRMGSGKTEAALQILVDNPSMKAAWVERNCTFLPWTLLKMNIDPRRILFVEAEDMEGVAGKILQSGVFELLILNDLSAQQRNEIRLRKLQLLSQRSAVATLLLSSTATTEGTWPLQLQVEAVRSLVNSQVSLKILKTKNHAGMKPALNSQGGSLWVNMISA